MTSIKNFIQQKPKRTLLGAGLISGLVFAPTYFLPGLLGLSILAYCLYFSTSSKQAFLYGYLFGFGHFLSSLWWVGKSLMLFNVGALAPLLPVPAALIIAAICALYIGCATYLTYLSCRKRPLIYWGVCLSLFWFIMELLRSFAPPFFPWNLMGYSLGAHLSLIQTAHIWQAWGLSILALIMGSIWLNAKGTATSLSILVCLFVYGQQRLNNTEDMHKTEEQPSLTVQLVQANIQQSFKWHPQERINHIYSHIALSQGDADVIIWPETAVTFLINKQPNIIKQIQLNIKPHQTVILGSMTVEDSESMPKYYNSIVKINKTDGIVQKYDKKRLVPFGEYFPLRTYFPEWVDNLIPGGADYSFGKTAVELQLADGIKALPLICYEAIFPFFVKKYLKDQKVLLNLTNDAWFDGTFGPYQHFAMARMRAVESQKPLLRAANTGITTVVDSKGRIVKRIKTKQEDVLKLNIGELINRTATVN